MMHALFTRGPQNGSGSSKSLFRWTILGVWDEAVTVREYYQTSVMPRPATGSINNNILILLYFNNRERTVVIVSSNLKIE